MNERAILAVLVCLPLVSGRCGTPKHEQDARVETGNETLLVGGTVHYKERILLLPGATLLVVAEDSSSKSVIAESTREISGSPPHAFSLTIDEEDMNERKDVTLRAEIHHGGALAFASKEPVPAFDGERPREDVELLVEPSYAAE
jgi:uncharacterized lipoprotein YbaY